MYSSLQRYRSVNHQFYTIHSTHQSTYPPPLNEHLSLPMHSDAGCVKNTWNTVLEDEVHLHMTPPWAPPRSWVPPSRQSTTTLAAGMSVTSVHGSLGYSQMERISNSET